MDWSEAWNKVQQMDRSGLIESVQPKYAHKIVVFNPEKIQGLSREELMCIADSGIPPFGGEMLSDNIVKIYTD